jgi:enoyl-CoA hydratase/3-hydroxyacyl-CoA dehydrogenase
MAERSGTATGAATPVDAELVDRFTLKALIEACLVLEEGIASLREIDLGMMAGAGIIPPPFARADQLGLDEVLARLERARIDWGDDFEPPTILRRLVAQGRLGVKAGHGFFPYPQPDPGWDEGPVKLETRSFPAGPAGSGGAGEAATGGQAGPPQLAIAWLDRPPANSISPDVVEGLGRAWQHVAASDRIRALIFASASPMLFCAGADIKSFTTMDDAAGRDLLDRMHALLRGMENSRVVTIAAVNGAALGGGNELAMACDLRIAAESATFGQPEINLGIIPGFGGTQRLPRLIGEARALELNLVGDAIDAGEALELGLVHRVVPDHELLDTALAWGRKLSGQAPIAVEQIKRISGAAELDAGLQDEKQGFLAAFTSEDAREGISAFLEKRAPHFRGR